MAHRWLVLLAAVFVSTFEFGLLFSLSALFIPILETFDTDRATAALVQSVSLGVTMSTGEIQRGYSSPSLFVICSDNVTCRVSNTGYIVNAVG